MATITEDYVSFETAKLLKEKGFNEACNRVYQGPNLKYTTLPISPLMSLGELGGFHPKQLYVNNSELGDIVYTAPTLQMAMKWLREVHKKWITITFHRHTVNGETTLYYSPYIMWGEHESVILEDKNSFKMKLFNSYEKACEAAIKYCLEHLT